MHTLTQIVGVALVWITGALIGMSVLEMVDAKSSKRSAWWTIGCSIVGTASGVALVLS